MKTLFKIFIILTILCNASYVSAQQEFQQDINDAASYIKEYPIKTGQVDEMGLVSLWQETAGMKALAFLHYKNLATKQMDTELYKRSVLMVRRIGNLIGSDDKTVSALANLMLLNYKFLDKSISGKIDYYDYSNVAFFTIYHGRVLAEEVEKKYGKGKKIIKTEKETNW